MNGDFWSIKILYWLVCCENMCFYILSMFIECYCKLIYWDYCFLYILILYGGFFDIFNGFYIIVFIVNRGRIYDVNLIYIK